MKFPILFLALLIIATNVNGSKYYCPMDGVRLSGGGAIANSWESSISRVSNWQMCGYFCKLTPNCNYWTWEKIYLKECRLLRDNSGGRSKSSKTENVSGDKNCFHGSI